MISLDKKLNLIVPIERDGGTLYVHSTPIARETFERYFVPISQAFTGMYTAGVANSAGPRVAALMLQKVATDAGTWDDVNSSLLGEIRRLSNLVILDPSGWLTVPLHDALRQQLLDEDEVAEVEGALVFFTLVSVMHKKALRKVILQQSLGMWGSRVESSSCMEFVASLPISTATASSGEKVNLSSIPG